MAARVATILFELDVFPRPGNMGPCPITALKDGQGNVVVVVRQYDLAIAGDDHKWIDSGGEAM